MSAANSGCRVRCPSGKTNQTQCAVDSARYLHRSKPTDRASIFYPRQPTENDIVCKIVMRELRSDDLNVESLRRARIGDRQMRFLQVHVSRLHALNQRASLRCF